jgi:ABC-type glycerol-3-phosphate transport system substrate-binding protein
MNNFQTILVAIFLAFFVFAVLIFSGAIKIGDDTSKEGVQGKIVIWGTFKKQAISSSIDSISNSNKNLNLIYVKKESDTYQQDLIEAFAEGKGPDLFIITQDMIIKNNNFIYKIPYESYSKDSFQNSFIDGASIYLDKEGIIAYPILVDPIVLYYNKDILSNEGIIYPPNTWDELFTLNKTLTKKDNLGTISQSMIGLGQYSNVNNAKEILATLLLQNNNQIIKQKDSTYLSALSDNQENLSVGPAESVIKFFVEFSNPSNIAYSWNSSMNNSLDMFTSGKMAFYLGKASELFNIEEINPNLSFDVKEVPQIKDSKVKRTFGDIYAVAVSKKTTNSSSAFEVAAILSTGDNAKNLSTGMSLSPALRTLLADKPSDNPYVSTFFTSSIITRSWADPNSIKSNSIFKELIDNVLSNNLSVGSAISKANGQLGQIIEK